MNTKENSLLISEFSNNGRSKIVMPWDPIRYMGYRLTIYGVLCFDFWTWLCQKENARHHQRVDQTHVLPSVDEERGRFSTRQPPKWENLIMIVKTPGSQARDIMPICKIDIRAYIGLILVIIKTRGATTSRGTRSGAAIIVTMLDFVSGGRDRDPSTLWQK